MGLVNPGGKPQDLFNKFKNNSEFKFLPIPFEKFDQYYVPTVFTEKDYPGYIKPGETVESIAVPVVLAVYNWPKESDRFRRVERFIDHYFDRMEELHKPPCDSKWRAAINLAAKIPGWTRYWVAEEKLKSMAAAKAAASPSPGSSFGASTGNARSTRRHGRTRTFVQRILGMEQEAAQAVRGSKEVG